MMMEDIGAEGASAAMDSGNINDLIWFLLKHLVLCLFYFSQFSLIFK